MNKTKRVEKLRKRCSPFLSSNRSIDKDISHSHYLMEFVYIIINYIE